MHFYIKLEMDYWLTLQQENEFERLNHISQMKSKRKTSLHITYNL